MISTEEGEIPINDWMPGAILFLMFSNAVTLFLYWSERAKHRHQVWLEKLKTRD